MVYRDVIHDVHEGESWIGINRPGVRNAFRERALDEIGRALKSARGDQMTEEWWPELGPT